MRWGEESLQHEFSELGQTEEEKLVGAVGRFSALQFTKVRPCELRPFCAFNIYFFKYN